jgi:hypothetical protein
VHAISVNVDDVLGVSDVVATLLVGAHFFFPF